MRSRDYDLHINSLDQLYQFINQPALLGVFSILDIWGNN